MNYEILDPKPHRTMHLVCVDGKIIGGVKPVDGGWWQALTLATSLEGAKPLEFNGKDRAAEHVYDKVIGTN